MYLAYIEQAKNIGFASIIIVGDEVSVLDKKHHNKGRGKKGSGVVIVSSGADSKAYMPMRLPLSRDTHNKAMTVGF